MIFFTKCDGTDNVKKKPELESGLNIFLINLLIR